MIIKASTKIAVASVLCRYLLSLRWLAGLGPEVDVTRDGIRWHLDLTEGIDLAIYLVGRFEPRTVHVFRCLIREGDVVINIGANISANTMELARCVGPRGRVIAFEPTLFALERLKQNLESNPELSRSVTPEQAALGDDSANSKTSAFYSSWPLLGHTHNGVHERHRGRLKSAVSASHWTLDHYLKDKGIRSIRLIKLDIDGNEWSVLNGAKGTIEKIRPSIVMEITPYVLDEKDGALEGVVSLLREARYDLTDISSGKKTSRLRRCAQSRHPRRRQRQCPGSGRCITTLE